MNDCLLTYNCHQKTQESYHRVQVVFLYVDFRGVFCVMRGLTVKIITLLYDNYDNGNKFARFLIKKLRPYEISFFTEIIVFYDLASLFWMFF